MPTLTREHRRMLENTVARARAIAEEGAAKVLRDGYAVDHHEPWPHMTADDRKLRNQLRAHGRQLGDKRDPRRETQGIEHLTQACAYEQWHRMLFARFLAENDLLLDPQHGVAMTLDDVRELARDEDRDWMEVAAELAQRMLLAVFRPDDPVLKIQLPPETRQQLEEKLASLPKGVFQADDSLGWVYQFWQSEEKKRINESGVKIGAEELPAVTELFTEDYMVWFLLHNTLGAWWTAKCRAESKDPNLPGYQWTYLRLKEDGMPAAGSFDDWPRRAADIKLLDPSMGSGHFLVFALPILVGFRMEEERLTREDAIEAVLRDNLFGLEIDPRCTQIAAFNLAWTAWRMIGYRALPPLNLACSGLGINANAEDWLKLAGTDAHLRETMSQLYVLFRQGPSLGSLIDPKRTGGTLFSANFEQTRALLVQALESEHDDDVMDELAVAARGIVDGARMLASTFTIVITNVPYLGTRRQAPDLREYLESAFTDARHDLATSFLSRCLTFAANGGTVATVSPQNWANIGSYKQFRVRTLSKQTYNCLASLGTGAFETISGEVVNVWLNIITNSAPQSEHAIIGADVSDSPTPTEKARALIHTALSIVSQRKQLSNPDSRIILEELESKTLLSSYANCLAGIQNGDSPRYLRLMWEIPTPGERWHFIQMAVNETANFGEMDSVIDYDVDEGHLRAPAEWRREALHDSDQRGKQFWKRKGVLVSRMGKLPAAMYLGDLYDQASTVIVPRVDADLGAVWAYCSSNEFSAQVRKLDKKVNVTSGTLVKVPFDATYWRSVAAESYPQGLPKPASFNPTQWIFAGHPNGSEQPLQVAVARVIGYRWPRQTGSGFMDCPALGLDGLEKHADDDGIVPLNAIAGEPSAADRLRALLGDSYGKEWSAAMLQEMLGEWDSLENWLRDGFFEEHCRIFHQRPFVWHVWDGRKDGFHVLINYHKLVAPNGEGRQTLEKLIYTYLGRWIERQTDEARAGKEGADARLTAGTHLKAELEKILKGERPYDIFVRWKPLDEQSIGWEPDINDGVRLNIRPWLTAKVHQPSRRDGCILRVTPKIPYGKDRGNEPHRPKEEFPWFWIWDEQSDDFMGANEFDGARWNELHYSLKKKKDAREKHTSELPVSAMRKA